jgi:hypothetical protein
VFLAPLFKQGINSIQIPSEVLANPNSIGKPEKES